jgi:hypothetical protein
MQIRILTLAILPTIVTFAAVPTPQEILAKAKAAMGGSTWDRITAIHSTGTVTTSGLKGPMENMEDLKHGANLERIDLGVIRQTEGFDGCTAWTQYSSGQSVVKGDAEAQREAANGAYLASRAYWYPARWPADLANAGSRKEGAQIFDVLRITPRGGQSFELWVDTKTGYFDRTVELQDSETETTFFSDYREVQGVKLPFAIRQNKGEAQYDSLVHLERVMLNPSLEDHAFALPSPPPRDCGFEQGQASATLPLEIEADGHCYFQAKLNGKGPFWFCLDGGVEGNMLSSTAAAIVGLKSEGAVRLTGAGASSEEVGFLKVDRLQIGGAWMDHQTFSVSPSVSMIGEIKGKPCAGIFGYDFFQNFVIRIEYSGHRMVLSPVDGWKYSGRGSVVPFVFRGRIPQVDGELDGMKGSFKIDTGSGGTLDVFSPFVAAHDLIAKAGLTYPSREGDQGFGGAIQGRLARFKELKLGGAVMERPLVGLSTMDHGEFASREGIGNLGAGFLKRFDVTFDYPRQKLYFEPNANHDTPDRFQNTHGLSGLKGDPGGFRITGLLVPSPLSEAGVQVGDVIVSLNGKSGKDLTPGFLGEALNSPVGTSLELQTRTNGKVRNISITLRDLL